MPKQPNHDNHSQSLPPVQSLDYRRLIEDMVVTKFGNTISSVDLARFLGFENGIIEKSRLTAYRTGPNSLGIEHDGSVESAKLARWMIQKNRVAAGLAGRLFGDAANETLLNRLPKTQMTALRHGSPYYYSNRECVRGHLNVRMTSNRLCLFCLIEKQKRINKSKVTRQLFGATFDEAMPVIAAFDSLPTQAKTVLLDLFIDHIEIPPEFVTKLATTYLDAPEIRRELTSRWGENPDVDGFLLAVRRWGKARKNKGTMTRCEVNVPRDNPGTRGGKV